MIVGRELCLFLAVDASRIPPKQRAAFLSLAVRRAAPFPDPMHEAAWSGAQASVWFWSRARATDLLGPQPLRVARFTPEPLLAGQPADEDGAQLLALAQGFEGRVWRRGGLVADRWWAQYPTEAEWATFLRGAGLPVASPPEATDAPIGDTPWVQQRRGARLALDDAGAWIRHGAIAAGALACLAVGFESGAGLRGLTDVVSTERTRQQLDAPLTRILEARAEAEREAEELQKLLLLRAPQGQAALLAEVKRVMPSQDWSIVYWNQPAIDRLEVTFDMATPDTTALVAAWEGSPMFTEVSSSVENAAKRVVLKARIVGRADPAPVAVASEATSP